MVRFRGHDPEREARLAQSASVNRCPETRAFDPRGIDFPRRLPDGEPVP